MRTFISYSSEISDLAGSIKGQLDLYGFNCFLAHEDILPQNVWPEEIIEELETCDLFLPILTPDFSESLFCQQEVGFAYCRNIEILPVMAPSTPMGMMSNIQGIKFNKKTPKKSCWKIVEHISHNDNLGKHILNSFINLFGNSQTYEETNEWVTILLNGYSFSKRQLAKIKTYIENNSQINETKTARNEIFKFMDNHPTVFEKDFVEWYDRKSRIHMR